jgi:hypothetical protein
LAFHFSRFIFEFQMRFLLHGTIHPDTKPALKKHEHHAHDSAELTDDTAALADPEILLPLLQKKQWNLLTTDTAFIQQLYEQKVAFPGIIVCILNPENAPPETPNPDQPAAIDRLFERYPRLTNRRLYTVTPNRVKIRQLPGAAQA